MPKRVMGSVVIYEYTEAQKTHNSNFHVKRIKIYFYQEGCTEELASPCF